MVAKRTTQQQMAANCEAWKTRCFELAEANHLIGSARWERESEINPTVEIFTVRSLSSGSIYLGRHIVGHDTVADSYICDCTAATYGNACSHVGSVLAAVKRRAQLLMTVETACQAWERENLGGRLLDIYRGWEATEKEA